MMPKVRTAFLDESVPEIHINPGILTFCSCFVKTKRLETYSKSDFLVDVAVEMPSEIFRSKVLQQFAIIKLFSEALLIVRFERLQTSDC